MPPTAQPSRTTPPRKPITPQEDAILRALLRVHYLTSRQVCRLFFAYPASLSHAREYMATLTARRLVQRRFLPRATASGSAPSIYTLSRTGMQRLADLGLEIPARARPYKERTHKPIHYDHALEISELLILAELLTRQYPTVELARLLHQRELDRLPTTVRVLDPKTGTLTETSYTPDAYLDVYVADRYEAPLMVEIDRGTEGQAKWRQRVRRMLAYHRGPYQQAFASEYLTICVIATPGDVPRHKRLTELIRWTAAELVELGAGAADRDLFRFATFDLTEATPRELFLEPRWLSLVADTPHPLLDQVE